MRTNEKTTCIWLAAIGLILLVMALTCVAAREARSQERPTVADISGYEPLDAVTVEESHRSDLDWHDWGYKVCVEGGRDDGKADRRFVRQFEFCPQGYTATPEAN